MVRKGESNGWELETKGPCSAPLFSICWAQRKRGKGWVMVRLMMVVIMEHEGGKRTRNSEIMGKTKSHHALLLLALFFKFLGHDLMRKKREGNGEEAGTCKGCASLKRGGWVGQKGKESKLGREGEKDRPSGKKKGKERESWVEREKREGRGLGWLLGS